MSREPEDDTESTDYRYDEDAEGHENQLEFDRDYATYDKLQQRGLLNPELEEKIHKDLQQDMPDSAASKQKEDRKSTGDQAEK